MTQKLAPSILIAFFKDATERLSSHPSTTTRPRLLRPSTPPISDNDNSNSSITPLLNSNCRNDYNAEYSVPVSLEHHRSFLMEEQLQSLKKCVSSSDNDLMSGVVLRDDDGGNENNVVEVTLEDVQSRLRELGSKNLSNIDWGGDEKVKGDLFDRMAKMNDAARLAFARSVVWAEVEWEEYFRCIGGNGNDESSMQIQRVINNEIIIAGRQGRHLRQKGDGCGPMDRSAIIDFCGLCSAAVRLPEVLEYLQDGRIIFPLPPDEVQEGPKPPRPEMARSFLPQYWIRKLQHMILRAVGYDHEFGMMELRIAILRVENPGNENRKNDLELDSSLVGFSTALQEAESRATSKCLKDGLSDQHEGGVTRVTSVKFSEKVLTSEGEFGSCGDAAPSLERMEQHDEDDKRAQVQMAHKAAALQQSIVSSLLGMQEEERNEKLKEAKMVHEEFIKGAMELPPGPERVDFIQCISPEKQKMLLIYKLWGQTQGNLNT